LPSKPPPVTMQCTWGWKLSCCPQVCSTIVIPQSAPIMGITMIDNGLEAASKGVWTTLFGCE
jgi:hypothetical protein